MIPLDHLVRKLEAAIDFSFIYPLVENLYSTLERRFKDSELFEQIFYRFLKEITDKGLLSADHVFIDSTHVKASVNKRKFEKKMVRKEARAYEEKLQAELNQDRVDNGKKPFPPEKFENEEMKEIKESTTDPESGYYVEDERTKQFAYEGRRSTV